MPFPFAPFEDLTADNLNEISRIAHKTGNETVNNVGTLQNDDHLVLAVAANTVHKVRLHLPYTSGATPGLTIGFTRPAGSAFTGGSFIVVRSGSTPQYGYNSASDGGLAGVAGFGADALLILEYVLTVAGTAGNLQFRWCQNVANASNTTLYSGGTMQLQRIA